MVMHKVRATSYLRRTISEPFSRRRPSMVPGGSGPEREISRRLMASESTISAIDEHEIKPQFTWQSDLAGVMSILLSKFNIVLIFCPLGILSDVYAWGALSTFWFNFFALIPLAAILGTATEELALHTGDLVGGLLNATFGNAVEMIFTVQALRAGLIRVVQGTLLGSMLSNLLLVLGMSFFAGGLFYHVQKFNAQGATCSTSLLLLACLGIICPTVTAPDSPPEDTLMISRYTALLIAATYVLFLFFQLYTHLSLFKDQGLDDYGADIDGWPSLSLSTSIILLCSVTLLISFQSDYLVRSIEIVVVKFRLPENFIGVILLPIVGNAAEHMTAVTVSMKNKPDLTMGVAVGSSTQIAMFMVPFAVLVGWAMDVPMTLAFSTVSAAVLAFSVLIVIGVVQDGESNWLEGVMLMVAYCIIAVVFWFHKEPNSDFGPVTSA
eukprot:Lankesteria_metandrocarpae@DN1993_c0_g1_i2.p1